MLTVAITAIASIVCAFLGAYALLRSSRNTVAQQEEDRLIKLGKEIRDELRADCDRFKSELKDANVMIEKLTGRVQDLLDLVGDFREYIYLKEGIRYERPPTRLSKNSQENSDAH